LKATLGVRLSWSFHTALVQPRFGGHL